MTNHIRVLTVNQRLEIFHHSQETAKLIWNIFAEIRSILSISAEFAGPPVDSTSSIAKQCLRIFNCLSHWKN